MATNDLNISGTKRTAQGICISLLTMSSHSFSLSPPNSPFHDFHDQNGENNHNYHWNLSGIMLYSVVVATTSEGISVSNSTTDFEPALFFSASKTDNNFPPTPSATQIKENTGNVLQST